MPSNRHQGAKRRIDVVGHVYGWLTVVARDEDSRWLICNCACGRQRVRTRFCGVRTGNTKSCGCQKNVQHKVRIDPIADPIAFRSRVMDLLAYDPETGVFTWRQSRRFGARAGDIAGHVRKASVAIVIDGRTHLANRLAWLIVRGCWPNGLVDHRDTDFTNNRFENLRDATPLINSQNVRRAHRDSLVPLLGVSRASNGRYRAKIKAAGRYVHLGIHGTPEAAHAAYVAAKRVLHEGCTL